MPSRSGLDMRSIEHLFTLLDDFGQFPEGVVKPTGRIGGTAFFPGGAGLFDATLSEPLPPMPVGGILVIGYNFDSEAGFMRSLERSTENLNGPTWRPLLVLLDRVGIDKHVCFFTNAYMGLKAGRVATGEFPGARDADFVQRCRAFMLEQLRVTQPRLILSLGTHVPAFLAPLSPALNPTWSNVTSLLQLDTQNAALVPHVQFPSVTHDVTVAAITHPSRRHINVTRRLYKGHQGDDAEALLLRDALAASQLNRND
ncbi:MAG: hypothetical protein ABI068_01325 [Ktedonobacterales bacterium]